MQFLAEKLNRLIPRLMTSDLLAIATGQVSWSYCYISRESSTTRNV